MKVSINRVSSDAQMQACFAIRKEVFVDGQNVPLAEELDGKDVESQHYLLTVEQQPVGVARVRYINDYAKIERVALLAAFQNQGLGKQLMCAIIDDLQKQSHLTKVHLSSQTHALAFYERLGFMVCSEEYVDAGIPHKDMYYPLHSSS